jgi:AcrR family transcriptional regulator
MREGAPRRTQQERVDESSRRLAAAAIELLIEKGYAHTTAKEISLRAGYSRSMVAERFGGKAPLFDAILKEYERRINVELPPDASGFDRVLAPVDALCRFVIEDSAFLRAMFIINFEAVHDVGELRDRIRSWLMGIRQVLREGIEAGKSDGSITVECDADSYSREILTSGIGYSYWWVVLPDQIDFPSILSRWREQVATSLRPKRSHDRRQRRMND